MTEPYLFERGIGQQMGDLCRLAVGDAKVTQTGEIVTLEDMLGRGAFGVSVEVPYTSGGVQTVEVTRCGKNLLGFPTDFSTTAWGATATIYAGTSEIHFSNPPTSSWGHRVGRVGFLKPATYILSTNGVNISDESNGIFIYNYQTRSILVRANDIARRLNLSQGTVLGVGWALGNHISNKIEIQLELGSTATDYEPYNGETYTIPLPADFYGGSISLAAGTVTSLYASDGTELAEPVVTEIDPISIPILAGVDNIWADVGTVTVSYYAADAQSFRPALWYPTIYRGLTSARYLIKRASGAIASFDDGIAAPLVGLHVAMPWRSEGYDEVEVTVNGTLTTIPLPNTIYGGYLDVVTGQLVATHDENGNLLANQKLYFLPPTNINALAGVNNIWSDAGDVAVSYRIDNG